MRGGRALEADQAAGDRVETDRRDARHLARLLHLDEYTPVTVPTAGQETARDLVRAREQCRGDLMRARHRTSKPLPRYGIVYSGGSAWTGVHTQWLQSSLPRGQLERASGAPTALAYHAGPDAVLDTTARRDRPGRAITETAADSEFTAVVRRLGCLRGVSDLTGLALAVEIGDRHRFTGRSIGSHVGLVPSEESSGQTRSQGSITKAGNKHVSRLLVEAAWRHRNPYRPGADLRRRWNRATPEAKNRGDRANQRLHHRWNAYEARHKKRVIANTAIARELAGFCRSLAVMDD